MVAFATLPKRDSWMVMISIQPFVSHLHDLSIFVIDNPFFSLKERCPHTGSHGTHNVASSISTNWVASNANENALITSLRRVHAASRLAKSVEQLGWVAWCLSAWPGDLSCPHLKCFFQHPAVIFNFFGRDFCYPPPIVIARPSNLILQWVNSQKCLMKIQ